MYDVSDNFRTQMKAQSQFRRLFGTIGGVNFDKKNVLQGTFTITNQCSDSSNIQIGQVYIGELKATFRGIEIARNAWRGKEIISYQGLKVGESFEDVLLGHYFVDDATWSKAGITITAYDAMSKFDKKLNLSSSEGRPYDFISLCCYKCKVELGMTETELLNFPNGRETFTVYPDNDMETYRDLLAWCAQVLGANAMINREGKLVLKQYTSNVVDSFDSFHRIDGGNVSDFNTFYTGISCVDMGKQTTSYYGAEVDNGLTMNLGSNPLIQLGSEIAVERKRRNILSSIKDINYAPMKVGISTPFVYDLMDVLEFTGGIVGDNGSIKTTITKYTWKFNGEYTIECSGSNPALANGNSKTDKNISGLANQVDASKIITYSFINAKELNISDSLEKVISISFTTKESATAMLLAELLLEVTTDSVAIVEVMYRLDNKFVETFVPKQTYYNGSQILTLYYPLSNIPNNQGCLLEVFLRVMGGTVKIGLGQAMATITGQGLLATYYEPKWNGTLNIEEEFTPIIVKSNDITIGSITESLSANTQTPTASTITEVFNGILLDNNDLTISTGIIEDIISRFVITVSSINAENAAECTFNRQYVDCDTAFKLITSYEYSAVEETIDSGRMSVLDMDFTEFASVDSIVFDGYTPESNKLYLYKDGDECTDVTGGWVAEAIPLNQYWTNSKMKKLPTLTKEESSMYIIQDCHVPSANSNENSGCGVIHVNNDVDVTGYTTLNILLDTLEFKNTCTNTNYNSTLVLFVKSRTSQYYVADAVTMKMVSTNRDDVYNNYVVSIDVSDISGKYDIGIGTSIYSTSNFVPSIEYSVSKAWLEM